MRDADAARAFAAEHAHYTDDLPLWRAVARERGGPVLDLGCATGRVAVELAGDGADVWALDGDPHMLSELRRLAGARGAHVAARIHAVAGDMRDFSLDVRFPLAICAMNTLQVLTEPADQLACLERVRAHLADGGEFWFDVSMPDVADILDAMGLVRADAEHADPSMGERWLHSSWYEAYDPVTQTAAYCLRVDHVAADGITRTSVRRHEVHLYTPSELAHLLARAGFGVLEAWGGFAGEPLGDGAGHQVYRCGVAE
ncbi:MAG: class I SAM-dependent methyltransferase [Thermoleophilia bacterium]|nr:class I SAM-dependent methyltransferase [Thermoleophilia bacterium]